MKRTVEQLDYQVLEYLRGEQAKGRLSVRAGEVARKFGVDSVKALGSMERIKVDLKLNKVFKNSTEEIQYLGKMLTASTSKDSKRIKAVIGRLIIITGYK